MWADMQRPDGSHRKIRGDGKRSGQWTDPQGSTGLKYVDVTISSAQLLALNATPRTVVAAPTTTGMAIVFESAILTKIAGTAYAGIAAGEDLAFKYTDGSGLQVGSCETTGFLDQATAQVRYATAYRAASLVSDITPVANAALVIQLLSGEITTGNTALELRIFYRTIPTVLPSTL